MPDHTCAMKVRCHVWVVSRLSVGIGNSHSGQQGKRARARQRSKKSLVSFAPVVTPADRERCPYSTAERCTHSTAEK
jgi:hypothetical protein